MRDEPLSRAFYNRDPATVARALLGKWLVRRTRDGLTAGRIVETEAYFGRGDPASHSHSGPTSRSASMFGPPGHAYIYSIHAMWCLNAVTQPAGIGSAVLIRSLEPEAGESLMARRRGRSERLALTTGPSKLCQAFHCDRGLDGWDLTRGSRLWIAGAPTVARGDIVTTPRIGLSVACERQARFCLRTSVFLSRKLKAAP